MVKQGISRTLYFVVGLVAIFAISRCNVAEYSWDRYPSIMGKKRQVYTQTIQRDELLSFMRLWPEFSKLGLRDELNTHNTEEFNQTQLNWKSRIWFIYHHWDVGRFFYVYERINYVLNALELHREAKEIIEMVKNIPNEMAKETINAQQERIEATPIDLSERLLIASHEKELKELFKQYP